MPSIASWNGSLTSANNDWRVLTVRTRYNQAEDLPPYEATVHLFSIELPLLTDTRDCFLYLIWRRRAVMALQALDLDHLIYAGLPRPGRDDPNVHHWLRLSRLVGFWLIQHIEEQLFLEIQESAPCRMVLADEVFQEIEARFGTTSEEIDELISRLESEEDS
ncbi:hypothetical protein N7532_003139 [Penicillium argentinense]|uniref:Uncharacterized protein n=1 Tax=Penicillium argentinense TaxID=1131581 RepID=A0A9W9FLW6_9EURO|nr:uncharacterized protein N7532_003139 [Penicillium argentinense]KAJ5102610.1 hypothetical protein N7532_003139 [Penicillium argentinense]